MYELMLDMQPDSAEVYARAIVASAMIPDTAATTDLMQRAMSHGIGLPDVLSRVRSLSFGIGAPDIYGGYLRRLRDAMPWMRRALDHELLEYYIFRNDGPNIVRYAGIMLSGLPDSQEFLHTLALGYLLQADLDRAVATWEKILALYPDDFDALIHLANHYIRHGDRDRALPYLTRAIAIHPTPYLQSLASSLR